MSDLSRHHEPLTELFARNPAVSLSELELDSYRRNGFLSGIPMLSEAQMDVLCADLATLMNPNH